MTAVGRNHFIRALTAHAVSVRSVERRARHGGDGSERHDVPERPEAELSDSVRLAEARARACVGGRAGRSSRPATARTYTSVSPAHQITRRPHSSPEPARRDTGTTGTRAWVSTDTDMTSHTPQRTRDKLLLRQAPIPHSLPEQRTRTRTQRPLAKPRLHGAVPREPNESAAHEDLPPPRGVHKQLRWARDPAARPPGAGQASSRRSGKRALQQPQRGAIPPIPRQSR